MGDRLVSPDSAPGTGEAQKNRSVFTPPLRLTDLSRCFQSAEARCRASPGYLRLLSRMAQGVACGRGVVLRAVFFGDRLAAVPFLAPLAFGERLVAFLAPFLAAFFFGEAAFLAAVPFLATFFFVAISVAPHPWNPGYCAYQASPRGSS